MGWWSRTFGQAPTSTPVEDQIAAYVADRLAGVDVFKLPTVVAGRTLTADVVATMQLVAHTGVTRIRPTPAVLRRPDPREPYRVTIEKIVNQLSRHGTCWYRIFDTGADGWPLAIRVIDRPRVTWQLSSTSDEITRVWVDGVDTPLSTVRYIPFRSDPGPPGTSPLADVYDTLARLQAGMYEFASSYYDQTAQVPPYALKHPARYTAAQADEFMDRWEASRTKRRPAFLSGGVELETFNPMSAADALLLDMVNYLDAVAARVMLIPPSLLNVEAHSSLDVFDDTRRAPPLAHPVVDAGLPDPHRSVVHRPAPTRSGSDVRHQLDSADGFRVADRHLCRIDRRRHPLGRRSPRPRRSAERAGGGARTHRRQRGRNLMVWLHREAPVEVVDHDVDARTVTVRLCRWNDPREVVDPDGTRYREQYPPGSLELAGNVHVADRHEGSLIGRALPDTFDPAAADGPTVELRIAHTIAGNDTLALIDAGVHRSVSMELEAVESAAGDGIVTRTRSIVHGLAFAFRPAHDAPILAVREQPTGDTTMPITDTATLDPPDTDTPPPAGDLFTVDVLNRELDIVRRDIIAHTAGTDTGHPLARFRSLDEAVTAGYTDVVVRDTLHRALADQITVNNPGVMQPAWVSNVFGIMDRGRPLISAFGVDDPGPSGMEVNWPYFDGDLKTLVGVQAAQKTPITSVRVDLKKGSEDLITYAGGSDLSYQLIRRSSPSYRDAYMRIMYAAYSAVTDAAAAVAVVAGAGVAYDIAADTDGSAFRTAVFEASVMVQAATGSPASFVVAATDVFTAIGGLPGLYPSPYGTQNVSGTADAASLSVNVSGINVIHDPYLPAGQAFVSNGQAASWYEDGPFTVVAEDVEKLGQNVAVWGLGAFGIHLPLGIVELNTLGVPSALSVPLGLEVEVVRAVAAVDPAAVAAQVAAVLHTEPDDPTVVGAVDAAIFYVAHITSRADADPPLEVPDDPLTVAGLVGFSERIYLDKFAPNGASGAAGDSTVPTGFAPRDLFVHYEHFFAHLYVGWGVA